MKKLLFMLYVSTYVLFTYSCKNDRSKIDISGVQIDPVTIDRMEQDVFTMDTSNIEIESKKLKEKYGKFYNAYINGILNNGGVNDSSYTFLMKRFISDKDMQEAYADCQKMYPNVSFLEKEMTEVFKRYRYYFPHKNLPNVITIMSGFNRPSIMIDNTLALGIEFYLGKDSKFYPMLGLPQYKIMFMNKENAATDLVRTWLFNEFPYTMNKNDFLSNIVYLGKIMYLNDVLLPETNDTLKFQYTQLQLDYCVQNEFNIWTYFIAQNLLYTTDYTEIMKFIGEGPFTSALNKESAPRIGFWIGWQIVKQYMNNNPNITMEQLMNESDAQVILTKSKYKPKK